MLCYGLFVGWHYSCGWKFDSPFWQHAKNHVWPSHSTAAAPEAVDCKALAQFTEMLKQPDISEEDWARMCAVPLTSYDQMTGGWAASIRRGSLQSPAMRKITSKALILLRLNKAICRMVARQIVVCLLCCLQSFITLSRGK